MPTTARTTTAALLTIAVAASVGCDGPGGAPAPDPPNGPPDGPTRAGAFRGTTDADLRPFAEELAAEGFRHRRTLTRRLPGFEADVDLYQAPDDRGGEEFYLRTKATPDALDRLRTGFDLKPQSAEPRREEFATRHNGRFLEQFPPSWPDLAGRELTWYANDRNTLDSNFAQVVLLAVDEGDGTAYLYHIDYNYTP